jgi:hypothetical protein
VPNVLIFPPPNRPPHDVAYDVDAAFMQLKRHERGIHAL